MSQRDASIRLTEEVHERAKVRARQVGKTLPDYLAGVLGEYADKPIIQIPKVVRESPPRLKETRVTLEDAVYEKAHRRARSQGKPLSQVVSELLADPPNGNYA